MVQYFWRNFTRSIIDKKVHCHDEHEWKMGGNFFGLSRTPERTDSYWNSCFSKTTLKKVRFNMCSCFFLKLGERFSFSLVKSWRTALYVTAKTWDSSDQMIYNGSSVSLYTRFKQHTNAKSNETLQQTHLGHVHLGKRLKAAGVDTKT